ncbi:hypothetical protein O181_026193 [Austropuccinia psidii MF-1]|uniref:Protein kinase domain-containing protein n=1 Tax=Austropuccinia psidii MF-1 TaxID=1389203 RepID=A0A9Q3CPA8_9BASI|nr:hypothetical protein [Austropuccinia psidii MF-1]
MDQVNLEAHHHLNKNHHSIIKSNLTFNSHLNCNPSDVLTRNQTSNPSQRKSKLTFESSNHQNHQNQTELGLWIQPSNQYNNHPQFSHSHFGLVSPPPTPSFNSNHSIHLFQFNHHHLNHHHNNLNNNHYNINNNNYSNNHLSSSFVPSLNSSAVPSISERPSFTSSIYSSHHHPNQTLGNTLLPLNHHHLNHLNHHPTSFVPSVSTVSSTCCSPITPSFNSFLSQSDLFYSNQNHSVIQHPTCLSNISKSLIHPEKSSLLSVNHTKRPFERSSDSSHQSRQLLNNIPLKHPKSIQQFNQTGPFDHRKPYLYSNEPFKLENSFELNLPHSLIFPCAQQEADPNFDLFPSGPELLDPLKDKMVKDIGNGIKPSTAPNHNLVGHRIDNDRLEFMSVLGLGAYGVVYLARDLSSPDMNRPRLYAVKALNKIGLDARQKSFQRREIALHSLASTHPSIVTLHAVIESPSCVFVILDYCPDGDLFGMITEKQRYLGKTESIKSVFIQIVEAVQFCHQLNISHRDLKPENILCKKHGDEVVLADFGLATAEKSSTDFGCGSTFYMSPECQGGLFQRLGSYSTIHNDIWSLGVILVNLTCGRNPWKQACPTDETFKAYLANPNFLRSILPISESCNSILKRIFALNPQARISLQELKSEILKVETFNMTPFELSHSTKATREAARAWCHNVPPSPKASNIKNQVGHESIWKNSLAKKAKKKLQSQQVEGSNLKNSFASVLDIWKRPVQYEISSSSSSSANTTYLSDSNGSHHKNSINHQDLIKSSFNQKPSIGHFNDFKIHDKHSSSRIRFVSPPPTPTSPHKVSKTYNPISNIPTGPLVSAFTSTSISNVSSNSSDEQIKKSNGLSNRFNHRKQFNNPFGSTNSIKDTRIHQNSRKKLFLKPMSFNRPNAPSPIVVKPYSPNSSHSSISSSKGLITPNKKGKHPTLTFLPSTPPSSVSPGSATFGFIKKPSKLFHCTPSNNILPPTPITPARPSDHSNLDCSRKNGLNLKKKTFDPNRFSLFSSSEEDDLEPGIDADFEIEDEDEDDSYKNSYPTYAKWLLVNESGTDDRMRSQS